MEVPLQPYHQQEGGAWVFDDTIYRPMRMNRGRSYFQYDYLDLRRREDREWDFKTPKEYRECQEAWLSLSSLHKDAYMTRGHWDYEKPNAVQIRGEPDLWNAVSVIRSGSALDWVGDPAAGDVSLMVPSISQVERVDPVVDDDVCVGGAGNEEFQDGNGQRQEEHDDDGDDDDEIEGLAIHTPRNLLTLPTDDGGDIEEPRELLGPKPRPHASLKQQREGPVASENAVDGGSFYSNAMPVPSVSVDGGSGIVSGSMEGQQGMDGDFANVVIQVHPQQQQEQQQRNTDEAPLRRSKRRAIVRNHQRQGQRGRREIGKPKPPLRSYIFFCRQEGKAIARNLKVAGTPVGRKAYGQELGRVWKSLSPQQKQQFIDMWKLDKARYTQEMEVYKRSRGGNED